MKIETFRDVDSLSPRDFEFFVRDVLAEAGWSKLEVTTPNVEYRHGDGGVDIFGEKGGRRFVVQVKQRSKGDLVDVSAFNQIVAGGELSGVRHRVLVTNSDFTTEVKSRALMVGVDLINRDALQDLWIAKRTDIGKRTKPRLYQQAVIDDVLEKARAGKSRFLLEMATGLGKTYTAAHLVRTFQRDVLRTAGDGNTRSRTLFVAHRVELLVQAATSFKNVFGVGNASYSACFEGKSPIDTDFVFASFDTLASRLPELAKEDFDIVIIDEAHHAPAETFRDVVQHFRPKLLVGLTATPFRTDDRDVLELFGGREGHVGKLDLVWALKNHKLAFPKYAVLLGDLDPSKIDALRVGMSVTDIDRHLFLHQRDREIVRIVEDTIAEKEIATPKAIVFCRNIAHIRHLLPFFPPGSATLVHSKMSGAERRENIRFFREGSARYVLTCDLFNEGIDIPETNILVFLRQTASRIVWYQQLGRGLRKTPNKEFVHVLDFVGSIERIDEVEQLKKAIEKQPRDPAADELDEDEPPTIHHDKSIEVTYTKGAADVLALLARHTMKITFRTSAIEALRRATEARGAVPPIEELKAALANVSLDQIATHFESYWGFLIAAFGDSAPREELLARAHAYVAAQPPGDGRPSADAIVVGTRYESLDTFTASELTELLGEDVGPPSTGSHTTPTPEDAPSRPESEVLLEEYRSSVRSLEDLAALPDAVRARIRRVFASEKRFVRLLSETAGS